MPFFEVHFCQFQKFKAYLLQTVDDVLCLREPFLIPSVVVFAPRDPMSPEGGRASCPCT